jgi:hypothetical protein
MNRRKIAGTGVWPVSSAADMICFSPPTWNSFQAYDDLSLTRGRHSLKFGATYERMMSDMEAYSDVTGGSLSDPSRPFSPTNRRDFWLHSPAR